MMERIEEISEALESGWKRYLVLAVGTICLIVGIFMVFGTVHSLYAPDSTEISHEEYTQQVALDVFMEVIEFPVPIPDIGTLGIGFLGILFGTISFFGGLFTGNRFMRIMGMVIIMACMICVIASFTFAGLLLKLMGGVINDM